MPIIRVMSLVLILSSFEVTLASDVKALQNEKCSQTECGVVKGLQIGRPNGMYVLFEDRELFVAVSTIFQPFLAASMSEKARICIKTYENPNGYCVIESVTRE